MLVYALFDMNADIICAFISNKQCVLSSERSHECIDFTMTLCVL